MLSVFCFVFAEYQSTVGRLYGQGEQIACVSTVSARVIILQIKFKTQWKDEKKTREPRVRTGLCSKSTDSNKLC